MNRLTSRTAIATCLLALGACAPHFRVAAGPGTCTPAERAAYHRTSGMATTQKVQRIQARYSLGARYAAAHPESWRSAARGACE